MERRADLASKSESCRGESRQTYRAVGTAVLGCCCCCCCCCWTYLAPLGLVLDVFDGANLGPDVPEVREGLVDDAQHLGRSGRGLGRCADDGHLLLAGQQAEGLGRAGRARGARGAAGVAGRGAGGDGRGAGRAGGGGAAAGGARTGRLRAACLCPCGGQQEQQVRRDRCFISNWHTDNTVNCHPEES